MPGWQLLTVAVVKPLSSKLNFPRETARAGPLSYPLLPQKEMVVRYMKL
jgi:hypothetical protein